MAALSRFAPSFALIIACGWGAFTANAEPFIKNQSTIQGIVVTETPAGMMGKATDIIVTFSPRDTKPAHFERKVGEEMSTSLSEAVRAVQVDYPDWDGTQVRVSFGDKYSQKDGGSAGTAYAVCLISMLDGFDIDPDYAMTGDITVDRRVRQIAGVAAKIKGATVDGAKVVGIPAENLDALSDLVLIDSLQPLLDTQVFTLETLEQSVELARADRPEDLAKAIALFDDFRETVGPGGAKAIRKPGYEQMLAEIVELAPHHASADMLLKSLRNEGPKKLSVTGSLVEVLERGRPAMAVLQTVKPGSATKEQRRIMREAKSQVGRMRSMTHPEVREFWAAMESYLASGSRLVHAKSINKSQYDRFVRASEQLVDEYNALSSDPKTIQALLRESQ